jgi:hypothetical protein
MMDQYIRNAISFIGAFVVVFGGLYLVDYYSGWRPFAGWRPFESQVGSTEIEMKDRTGSVFPIAQAGSAADRASNGFSGRHAQTVTNPQQNFRCDSNGACSDSKVPGRHR